VNLSSWGETKKGGKKKGKEGGGGQPFRKGHSRGGRGRGKKRKGPLDLYLFALDDPLLILLFPCCSD